jgi:hypothetical protein
MRWLPSRCIGWSLSSLSGYRRFRVGNFGCRIVRELEELVQNLLIFDPRAQSFHQSGICDTERFRRHILVFQEALFPSLERLEQWVVEWAAAFA